ncbi:MAG: GTPase ObgE [Dehalococcoidales bacterium]|nr:MAG: GTPase ObgE [Dehalococcoidales bacterium]
MFDITEIRVRAGDGGDGAISFRHEKYVPFGGPDGGDGGNGGNIIIEADATITNLLRFRQESTYKAERGRSGQGSKKHGKRGKDLVLVVPVGTVISDKEQQGEGASIADLEQDGQRVVVAKGGKAGLGNVHFASSTNQAPRIAQKGEPGEEKTLLLELRLIADVGIIGYPNVGKSTLLTASSAAKPEIADYPFTTRAPVVGVVEVGLDTFVLAEIPGLIEGAHRGRGLGHDFLRHATRTRMFLHVVDGSLPSPAEDMTRVNTELGLFDTALARRPQLVVVNKIDLPEVRARLTEIMESFRSIGITPLVISAVTGEGVAELMAQTWNTLKQIDDTRKELPEKVFRPRPQSPRIVVYKDRDTFVVEASALERIIARSDVADAEVRWQLNQQIDKLGVNRALKKAGAVPGDKIRCSELEWEW